MHLSIGYEVTGFHFSYTIIAARIETGDPYVHSIFLEYIFNQMIIY